VNIALVIIFAFLALAIFLGIRARAGKDMDLEQWTVGGRGFGTIFVFLLMAGEIYTTFTFLGGSGWAYGQGLRYREVLATGGGPLGAVRAAADRRRHVHRRDQLGDVEAFTQDGSVHRLDVAWTSY